MSGLVPHLSSVFMLEFLPWGTPSSRNFLDLCLKEPTHQPPCKALSRSSFCLHSAGLPSWPEGRGASPVGRGLQRNNQENHQALPSLPCARWEKWWVWEEVRVGGALLGEREPAAGAVRNCKRTCNWWAQHPGNLEPLARTPVSALPGQVFKLPKAEILLCQREMKTEAVSHQENHELSHTADTQPSAWFRRSINLIALIIINY